jgi:hypothetical protein
MTKKMEIIIGMGKAESHFIVIESLAESSADIFHRVI